MHRRILLAAAALLLWLPSLGFSQFSETSALRDQPAIAKPESVSLKSTLEAGYTLERERLWADALVHYEDASRQFPNSLDVKQRLQIVRIRFDLSRRYSDSSFVDSTQRLGVAQALELFREVCVKIQSHYVEPPNWKALVQRGNRNVEVALRDHEFATANGMRVEEEQIAQFVRYLFQHVSSEQVTSREEAEALVHSLARMGESHIGIPSVSLILEYVCGATSALDEYSTFLTAEQLDDVYSQIEGNFVGLGIELKSSSGSLLITNVIKNGPAFRAGILKNDRIIEVDGQSMQDISTDKAADLLKGEKDSTVQVVVQRVDGSAHRLNVRRERVEVPSIEDVAMMDRENGIGYLKLTSFQKTTSRDMDAALWKLHREGMRSLIIDVRHNPGGLLTQSVEVADKFVLNGTIVSTRGRSPREDFDYKAHRTGTWGIGLVVLIDDESASASEIFAAAIHDHGRGTIVGTQSYGKGSVQGIFPLRTGKTGIRLTTAKFYSPKGQPISNNGVKPDVTVETGSDEQDVALATAVEVARQRVAQRSR